MEGLSDTTCLRLWERGETLHSLDRAVLVLREAYPDEDPAGIPDWTLGRRNRALVEVRQACFGSHIQGWARCGKCGEQLELEMDGNILTESAEETPLGQVAAGGASFRLPSSRDLAKAAGAGDVQSAALRILESCRVSPGETPDWSEGDLEEIGDKLSQADPLAEIQIRIRCPQCAYEWEEAIDLPAFLWTEIESRAKRLLLDVHALASAYGWTESEILSLGAAKRALYRELVHS